METNGEAYKAHLEGKYFPGRGAYLKYLFYPKILQQFSRGEIIDLGCGTGEFLHFVKFKKRNAFGIDNNPFLVEKCASMGLNVELDDITRLEHVKDNVENALCDNVLEHLFLNQIDAFFAAIKNKMAKNGTMVIIVPDKNGFRHDCTHKTFVTPLVIEAMCMRHQVKITTFFFHPINIGFIGYFLYLNMQVFTIRF